jgi:hypothetical protein
VYFLNRLVQTPWTKTMVMNMTKTAQNPAFIGMFGRYAQ